MKERKGGEMEMEERVVGEEVRWLLLEERVKEV